MEACSLINNYSVYTVKPETLYKIYQIKARHSEISQISVKLYIFEFLYCFEGF